MPTELDSLLMLGADRYVLRACARLDVAPVVLQSARARDNGFQQIPRSAVTLFCENNRSLESVLGALHRAGLAERRFDAIQTTSEQLLVNAAALGQVLDSRAIAPATALLFRDKFLQKRRVRDTGVATARALVIEDLFAIDETFAFPYERGVLKPVAGAGTEATSAVAGLDDLLDLAGRYRRKRTATRTFVLEEFVTGDEWTADGVVAGGELLFYGLGCYETPCLTTLTNRAALCMRKFDPDEESWAYKAADDVVRQAIAALGLTDGVFHMELFHDPATGHISFSECAARRGGALTAEEILAKFGVDLGQAAVECALGRTPELNVRVRAGTVGSVYLPSRPGTLISCPSPAELTARPGVEFARIELPFGYRMAAAESTATRIGMAMIAADNPQELEQRRSEVLRWFDERLVVAPDTTTTAELRAWHDGLGETGAFADVLYGA